MPADAASMLVGRSFRIAAVDGIPTLGTPVADITFGADGRVTGRATVNRFFGPYELHGDALTLGPLATTLMAGRPEAMDQERRVHAALSRPLRVSSSDREGPVELREGTEVVLLLEQRDAEQAL